MRAMISALVILRPLLPNHSIIGSRLTSQPGAENLAQLRHELLMKRLHLGVRQRPVLRPVGNRIREALLAFGNGRAAVLIEYLHTFDEGVPQTLDPVDNPTRRKVLIHDDSQVAFDGRKSGKVTYR